MKDEGQQVKRTIFKAKRL